MTYFNVSDNNPIINCKFKLRGYVIVMIHFCRSRLLMQLKNYLGKEKARGFYAIIMRKNAL